MVQLLEYLMSFFFFLLILLSNFISYLKCETFKIKVKIFYGNAFIIHFDDSTKYKIYLIDHLPVYHLSAQTKMKNC